MVEELKEEQKKILNSLSGSLTPEEKEKFLYSIPKSVLDEVLSAGNEISKDKPIVKGYDFNNGIDYEKIIESYATTGLQATIMSQAIEEINKMIKWRLSDVPVKPDEDEEFKDPSVRAETRCTIFLGYTSNMISCGIREIIRYLCEYKMVDCIVTSCGGIEEDLMKCWMPTYIDSYEYNGSDRRIEGLNMIGNMMVPNANYAKFEDWIIKVLDGMYKEQVEEGKMWTPRMMIDRFGEMIDNKESVYYWCHANNIPVYCPSITDGSIGEMLHFFSYKHDDFHVDINPDIRSLNEIALNAKQSGMIILGGGMVKHHIANANLYRNGANYSVFINTSQAYEGSDTGAPPNEAVTWGKIAITAKPVKLYCEVSLVWPIIVAQTFAKYHDLATRVKKQ